ncbi:hypothetical protein DUI87_21014 [Hirundo rustica rustica]|uniref:Uncharacterized protein n=1 Tax=Hirundo rustica rustica TaxID=333673 RepID=A0A3M0JLN3_HIRRU|nr:hypothetical protein DUI87_21014 [Hirundo rustica rustica]
MEGPGRAAEPSGGADDGAGEPRWPQPPEESTDRPAEPRCETPPAGPQPTPTGLPTLLAYRPGSSQANVQHQAEENAEPTCECCGNLQRPFPFSEDVPLSEEQEDRFCCERSRELCEFIMVRKRLEDASSLPRAISSESIGSEANLLLSKEKENWRQKRLLITELADQSLQTSATEGGTPVLVLSAAEPELEPRLEKEPKPELWLEEEPKKQPQPEKPEPEPQPEEKPKKESWPKEEPEPEPWLEKEPEPELWPEEEPEEPQPEEKPKPEPQPEEKFKELWPEEELELEHRPKKEPGPEPKPRPKEEPGPKSRPEEEPEHKEPMFRSALGYDFSLLGKKASTCS